MTKVVHTELSTTDMDAAKKFYRGLFNWKYLDIEMGGGMTYTMVAPMGTPFGLQAGQAGQPSAWVNYIEVKSVDRSVKKAVSLGGAVAMPKVSAGGGEYAVVVDPTGATIGLWKPAKPAKPAKKKVAKKVAKKKVAKKKVAKKKVAKKKVAKKKVAKKKKTAKKAA